MFIKGSGAPIKRKKNSIAFLVPFDLYMCDKLMTNLR